MAGSEVEGHEGNKVAWSGQVRFVTRPKSRTMRAKREKKRSKANKNEGAQMSNELENDGGEFRATEADGVGYYETETGSPSSTNPQ